MALAAGAFAPSSGHSAETSPPSLAPPLAAPAPDWRDLVAAFAQHPDTLAAFTERRTFPFRKTPVELQGEVRVSTTRGLSLHYTAPERHIVILDARGMLLRTAAGDETPPADARGAAAHHALLAILRFDLAALERDFELHGERRADAWTLTLEARTEAVRRGVGRIVVLGEGATIRRLEFRTSARQAIEIEIAAPCAPAAFTAEELKQFFR